MGDFKRIGFNIIRNFEREINNYLWFQKKVLISRHMDINLLILCKRFWFFIETLFRGADDQEV